MTNSNRLEYIHRVANFKLNAQIKRATDAFRKGLEDVIASEWINMFNEGELQVLPSTVYHAHSVDTQVEALEFQFLGIVICSPSDRRSWVASCGRIRCMCRLVPLGRRLWFSHVLGVKWIGLS